MSEGRENCEDKVLLGSTGGVAKEVGGPHRNPGQAGGSDPLAQSPLLSPGWPLPSFPPSRHSSLWAAGGSHHTRMRGSKMSWLETLQAGDPCSRRPLQGRALAWVSWRRKHPWALNRWAQAQAARQTPMGQTSTASLPTHAGHWPLLSLGIRKPQPSPHFLAVGP